MVVKIKNFSTMRKGKRVYMVMRHHSHHRTKTAAKKEVRRFSHFRKVGVGAYRITKDSKGEYDVWVDRHWVRG